MHLCFDDYINITNSQPQAWLIHYKQNNDPRMFHWKRLSRKRLFHNRCSLLLSSEKQQKNPICSVPPLISEMSQQTHSIHQTPALDFSPLALRLALIPPADHEAIYSTLGLLRSYWIKTLLWQHSKVWGLLSSQAHGVSQAQSSHSDRSRPSPNRMSQFRIPRCSRSTHNGSHSLWICECTCSNGSRQKSDS